jgi:hypothetical protein
VRVELLSTYGDVLGTSVVDRVLFEVREDDRGWEMVNQQPITFVAETSGTAAALRWGTGPVARLSDAPCIRVVIGDRITIPARGQRLIVQMKEDR